MIVKLVLLYFGNITRSNGLADVSTFLVLNPKEDGERHVLENVLDQMIEDKNPVISGIILEIYDNYKSTPESNYFFRDIKKFVTLYDKENLREKDEDDIVNFFDRNRKLVVDIMMGIRKHLDQFLTIETHNKKY